MRKIEYTQEHLEWYRDRVCDNVMTETEIGEAFKTTFPDFAAEYDLLGRLGRSISVGLKRAAQQRQFVVPVGNKVKSVPAAHTVWLDENPELVIEYAPRLIVMSDVHTPSHSPEVVAAAAQVVEDRHIDTCIWNGDLFDNEYVGHKGVRSHYAATFSQVVAGAQGIINLMTEAGITHHVFLQGNHDDKMFRQTDGEIDFKDFLEVKVFPGCDFTDCKVDVTNRYYVIMRPRVSRPWPWTSHENFPTRFTHQKEYGRNPCTVAEKLASKFFMNTVCGHQHHLTKRKHGSGLVYVADAGTCQDPRLPSYKNKRDTTHPQWDVGFLTMIDGQLEDHHIEVAR